MSHSERHDWTAGAPKWAAVVVLGAASLGGISWAVGRDGRTWRTSNPVVAAAPAPSPAMEQPRRAEADGEKPAPAKHTAAPIRRLINLNTADAAELELLPGIGPALAKRIIEYRATRGAFRRVEDLDAVKGIGPRILERVKGLVVVE